MTDRSRNNYASNVHAFDKTNVPSGAAGVARVIDAVRAERAGDMLRNHILPASDTGAHRAPWYDHIDENGVWYVDTTPDYMHRVPLDHVTPQGYHGRMVGRPSLDYPILLDHWEMQRRANVRAFWSDLAKGVFMCLAGLMVMWAMYLYGAEITAAVDYLVK